MGSSRISIYRCGAGEAQAVGPPLGNPRALAPLYLRRSKAETCKKMNDQAHDNEG
jgi:hypothetical protein